MVETDVGEDRTLISRDRLPHSGVASPKSGTTQSKSLEFIQTLGGLALLLGSCLKQELSRPNLLLS